MVDLRLFCLFVVCLSLPGGFVNGAEIRNITARGHWRKIFEDVNGDTVPNEYTAQCFYGVKTEEEVENTVTVKGSDPTYYGMSEGDQLKILLIDFGTEGRRKSSASFRTLKETEIHRQREQTLKFTIQPGQKIVKWQFVVDVAGNEYQHNLILTHANDDETPKDFDVTVTLARRPIIHFGSTRIRIKHRKTDRYITIIERDGWPAATTGLRKGFHFLLYNYDNHGVVIRTLNSIHSGFEYLSVWKTELKGGWIYGSLFQNFNENKQIYWTIFKSFPLYEGDIVTFMSKHFRDAYLCRSPQMGNDPDNSATDVYACNLFEDEWILELAF